MLGACHCLSITTAVDATVQRDEHEILVMHPVIAHIYEIASDGLVGSIKMLLLTMGGP
jgi:hypothetical protein